MKKATLFIAKDCPHCQDAKKKIKKLKKSGKLCYNFKCVDVNKSPGLVDKKGLEYVPICEIDGKLLSLKSALKRCPI